MNDPVAPLAGKVALVTGATSGIGFCTAAALARMGAAVFVTGRDEERGRDAEARLRAAAGHAAIHFLAADASTVGGNQRLAQTLLAATERLDVLVNNVGGAFNDRATTDDGYEASLATNAVGPFALTGALLPLLRTGAPARVVNVASAAHTMWKGDPLADLHAEASFLGSLAYARSKLLNVLWTFELARRLEGSAVVANAVDPGTAWTSMTQGTAPRSMPTWLALAWPLVRWFQRRGTPEDAARSSIFAASAPEAAHLTGVYFGSDARPERPSAAAVDPALQARAWERMTRLVAEAPTALHAPADTAA